jgi:hypothetical protein
VGHLHCVVNDRVCMDIIQIFISYLQREVN